MLNLHDSNGNETIATRAAAMVKLTAALRSTVAEMVTLYYADDSLNDIQPPEFAPAIPMSLDEWQSQLGAAVEGWQKVHGDLLNVEAEEQEQARIEARAIATVRGFSDEIGGGGSVFLSRYAKNGARVWITCDGGMGTPAVNDFCVCYYPAGNDGEEPPLDIRNGSGASFVQAVNAALAMLAIDEGALS